MGFRIISACHRDSNLSQLPQCIRMKWLRQSSGFLNCYPCCPGGVSLYRLSQEQFTKSLVPTRERVDQKVEVGLRYFEWLTAPWERAAICSGGAHLDISEQVWHPSIPLLVLFDGAQPGSFLFDLAPVLDDEALVSTNRRYGAWDF